MAVRSGQEELGCTKRVVVSMACWVCTIRRCVFWTGVHLHGWVSTIKESGKRIAVWPDRDKCIIAHMQCPGPGGVCTHLKIRFGGKAHSFPQRAGGPTVASTARPCSRLQDLFS